MMKRFLILMSSAFVVGCNEPAAEPEQVTPPTMLNTQLDALEKAENVEHSLQEATNARDEEMRKQGI